MIFKNENLHNTKNLSIFIFRIFSQKLPDHGMKHQEVYSAPISCNKKAVHPGIFLNPAFPAPPLVPLLEAKSDNMYPFYLFTRKISNFKFIYFTLNRNKTTHKLLNWHIV